MARSSVPRLFPFAAKDTEPVGLVPKTDAVNVIAALGAAVIGEACNAVVLVMGAGVTGVGLVWFSKEAV